MIRRILGSRGFSSGTKYNFVFEAAPPINQKASSALLGLSGAIIGVGLGTYVYSSSVETNEVSSGDRTAILGSVALSAVISAVWVRSLLSRRQRVLSSLKVIDGMAVIRTWSPIGKNMGFEEKLPLNQVWVVGDAPARAKIGAPTSQDPLGVGIDSLSLWIAPQSSESSLLRNVGKDGLTITGLASSRWGSSSVSDPAALVSFIQDRKLWEWDTRASQWKKRI